MHSSFLNTQQVFARARHACDDLKKITDSGNVYTTAGLHRDPVQTLVMRRGSNSDGIISPLFESAAIEAEKRSSGAGEIFLKIVSNFLAGDLRRHTIDADFDQEWQLIKDYASKASLPVRKSDINQIIRGNETFKNLINQVINLICAGDKVIVKKSSVQKSVISRKLGYSFNELNIDPRFYAKGFWTKKNGRIILIDGVIESVSEIHKLLDDLSKSRQPAMIFCIDALPDVCETLAKNFESGNLDVILVKIPVTEIHVNTLVDLGVIMNTHPTSATQGETISLGCSRQNKTVSRLTLAKGQVIIEDEENNDLVKNHLNDLKKRLDDKPDHAIILEPRIQRLRGAAIQIDVGIDDLKNDPSVVEKLDRFFRSMPRLMKSGIINKKDMSMFSADKLCLLFGETDVASTETVIRSIEIFLSIRQTIKNSGAAIESL